MRVGLLGRGRRYHGDRPRSAAESPSAATPTAGGGGGARATSLLQLLILTFCLPPSLASDQHYTSDKIKVSVVKIFAGAWKIFDEHPNCRISIIPPTCDNFICK